MGEVGDENRRGRGGERTVQKSYFDVLGICCPSEVPLIEKILKPIDGVVKVSVVVPSKTVIVEHDPLLISQLQLVKALNQARLEATIRAYGTEKILNKWPSPYIIACGFFLLVSLLGRFFHPLRWLAIVAVAVGLPPIVLRSFAAVRRITLDINILMLIAVGGAIALRDFSEAGFIVFLFTAAEWLETRASHKATAGMSALMSMAPQKAVLAETGEVVYARDVKVNTMLAVKAGEVIPIDGIVVEGKSEANEQSLTGESFPVPKQAQSLVWAGTLNIDGYISVKTTALSEDSAVAKMARLVEEAQNSRSKNQRLIDSCTKYYTPVVVMIAGCVAVIPLILRVHYPKHWFQLALVLLVSACPCALVLSTPVATFCSLLEAARIGLLVKGGDVLEALARTRVVAFDKTGTITKGEFTVVDLRAIGSQVTMNTLLYWISSIERKSSHPMASALVDHARLKSVESKPDDVCEFQIYPGEGVYGEIDGNKIFIGNRRIAAKAGCDSVPEDVMDEAVTRGYVFLGAELIGTFTLSDSCRTGAAEAIRELKSLGLKTVILTGDSNAAAMHTQNQLGHAIDVVHAELLPEDKVRIINELRTKEGPTTMIGDGMNDAPALAAANVGIAMGISGSAVAMETSHITLMSNDILKIPRAIRFARRTHRKIIANIIFSVITKVAILALAVAGHPLLWAAVLADVGTCLVVILNSMMLLRTKSSKAKKHRCSSSSHASGAHKHSHTGHSSTNHDQCCQDLEGRRRHSETEKHHECNGSVNCSDDAHTHAPAHEDQCSHSQHRQLPDHKHCCEEAGGEHNAAVDCGSGHHCNSTHKAEDHAEHAHVHCDLVHTGSDENHHHVENHKQVGSCTVGACSSSLQSTATSSQHAIFIGCEEETHGEVHEEATIGADGCGHHGGDAAKHCDSHRSRTKQREIGQCCRTVTLESRKKDCCPSAAGATLGKRAAGGCRRSYRRECGNREGCCGGGIAHLPEIIIE